MLLHKLPLARNQYIINSPGIFPCIRAGANTGAACIPTEMNSLPNMGNIRTIAPRKYFPVYARVRIQAPHVFARKLIPQEIFPACIGFVPGGIAMQMGAASQKYRGHELPKKVLRAPLVYPKLRPWFEFPSPET